MKVTGPRSVGATSASKRKTGVQGTGSAFAPEGPQAKSSVEASPELSGASAVSSVDALLALQGVGDYSQSRRQASERAFSLLDVLDDLKIALLEGGIPRERLSALMDLLQSRRDQTGDPKLEAVLNEVEVRAAVELAKYDA
ncbi:flagellar assembly protein FliX [Woodsholea maritima]|uniref:flagellar assembly protein FliX n=1 Tax=Woodsholea maritima TaxID=240237 RepID=UPI00036658CA|nr:flagellar assembly protein FliX [Woodsholea maritima]